MSKLNSERQTCPACGGSGTEQQYYTEYDAQHQSDEDAGVMGWMMGQSPTKIMAGERGPPQPCGMCRGQGTSRLITKYQHLILAVHG